MQISSRTSLDTFLASRPAAQAPRGNGDNDAFARLMQQRRDQATPEPTQAAVRQPAADSSNSTYDMTPKPSEASTSDAKAGASREKSADGTTRSTDGDTARTTSESRTLAARKAEAAKLDRKQAKGAGEGTADKVDPTTQPVDKPGETTEATGTSPADWLAQMAGVRPKQAPIVEPADGEAAPDATTPAVAVATPGRTPIAAEPDATQVGGGKQPKIGIVPEPDESGPTAVSMPVNDQPISVNPSNGADPKLVKAEPTLQPGDGNPAMLQAQLASAMGTPFKTDKTSTTEPVANADGNAGVSAASAVAATGAPISQPADVPAVQVTTPVHAPEFKEALGVQISMMAKDGVQHAQLHLNPADMGPISVQIATEGTHARVDFGADNAATRHILEAGLPELASALQNAGMTLTGGGVSQHAQGGSQGGTDSNDGSRSSRRTATIGIGADTATALGAAPVTRGRAGGLDLYA